MSTNALPLSRPEIGRWRTAAWMYRRGRGWGRGLVRGREGDAAWERPALIGLLGGTALLFGWNLAASGWANAYYSAAVQAGSQDWLAMLFGSFDASNAITVDKTPASLWVMEISARIFGFNAWSVLAPQAIEGVLAVWLLYSAVKRRAGAAAALAAGAVLALTPVAALMFRFNNPDALLTLLLTAAAYATVRAIEVASARWLVAAGVAIGFAFLTKMLQGFLVIPAFTLAYLVAAPTGWWRRVRQVGAAAVAVVVSAGWWVALVTLWPAAARPYIGGSQTNSVLELMLGYNGLGRITGEEVGRVGGGGGGAVGGAVGGGPFSDGAGWLRLFNGELASQVSWLLPAALAVLLAILWLTRRAPRTDALRAQALIWGGWLVVTGLVFSLMQGIFHAYYSVALAPAIGAMVGLGVAAAWERRDRVAVRIGAALVVAGSAGWVAVLLGRSAGWNPWLAPVVVIAGGAAAGGILAAGSWVMRPVRVALAGTALAALLLAPAVGSVATASQAHTGAIPNAQPTLTAAAGPALGAAGSFPGALPGGFLPQGAPGFAPMGGSARPLGGPPTGGLFQRPPAIGGGGGMFAGRNGNGVRLGGLLDAAAADPALVSALQADADAYAWVAATTGSNDAAGLSLSSGEAVMSIGGFNGTDPSPTLAEFQAHVAAGEIHYYVAGLNAAGFPGANGGSNVAALIADWVANNFESQVIGGATVYDLTR